MDSLHNPYEDLYTVDRLQGDYFGHFTMTFKSLHTSVVLLLILTVITGLIYPLVVTGIAQLLFPVKAHGSLIVRDGITVGSELIGQPFTNPGYFWGRPSATQPSPYNASASSGSNQGPLNPALLDSVRQRVQRLRAGDSTQTQLVPVDLVTASASGLDPHISVESALFQVPRIARARSIAEEQLRILVNEYTEGRQWGVLGERRVNVLLLNTALDKNYGNQGRR